MSALEVAEQTADVESTRRVPLGRRVVAMLESAQSILNTDRISDGDLRHIRDGDRHVALRQVEQTSAAAVASLASGPSRTVRVLSVQQLLAELHAHWHEIQQDLLAQQMRMMGGVRKALHRLRGAETMRQIIDRAAVEICRSCGVDRCVLMSAEIFYTSEAQRQVAQDTIADVEASGLWPGKVVTEISEAVPFWEAEPEHRDYLPRIPARVHLPLPAARLEAATPRNRRLTRRVQTSSGSRHAAVKFPRRARVPYRGLPCGFGSSVTSDARVSAQCGFSNVRAPRGSKRQYDAATRARSEMPEIPDVSAIARQIKARIKQIEEQLKQHRNLSDELERLRDALTRLEGEARSRVSGGRRDRTPAVKTAGSATRTRSAKPASAPARAPRGQNKAKVLDALKDGPRTASEIAKVTGIGTGTVSTMLTKMAKSGELAKAERGYKLPQ